VWLIPHVSESWAKLSRMPGDQQAVPGGAPPVLVFLRERDQAAINVLAVLTLVVTVLLRVVFATARPWFAHGGDLADLITDLGVGYLAAWFFYYLVSWRPAFRTRQRLAVTVTSEAFGAMAHASQLKGMLRGSSSSKYEGPMTRGELDEICEELHILSPSTDSDIRDLSVHAPIIQSILRYATMTRARTDGIVEAATLFDADVIANALAIRSATLMSLDGLAELATAGVIAPPGNTLAALRINDQVWEFVDLADKLWLTVVDRYPWAAATVGPSVLEDHRSGRSRVLAR